MSDPRLADLRKAAHSAYEAGLHIQAARLFQTCAEQAKLLRDEPARMNALFWQGNSLMLAGEHDAALPLLLQVANAATVAGLDPGVRYDALTDVLDIAAGSRPYALLRRILADGDSLLASLGKPEWRHKLDLLNSLIELARGQVDQAARLAQAAWHLARRAPGEQTYAHSEYLMALARAAFARRDPDTVRTCEADAAAVGKTDNDRLNQHRITLLRLRAERIPHGLPHHARDTAQAAAALMRAMTLSGDAVHREIGRLWCLTGDFAAAAAVGARTRTTYDRDVLAWLIYDGDAQLCRARAALGLAVADDEYDVEFPLPGPAHRPPRASAADGAAAAAQALDFFTQAIPVAAREDERLETGHWSRTVSARIDRARSLLQAAAAWR